MPPYLAVERRLIERLLANLAWEEVRKQAVLDEWLAAALTVPTTAKLLTLLPEEAKALAREAALREEEARRIGERLAELRDKTAREGNSQKIPEEIEEAARTAEAARRKAQEAGERAISALESTGEEMERMIARTAVEAAEAARSTQEAIEACRAWSTEPGRPHAGVSGKEMLAVAEKLAGDSRLQEIVRLAGRFTRVALQKRRSRVKHEPVEVAEIETGGALSRVLPSELAALADPARKMDFYRRFAEGKLLQYRLDARFPQGRGPLVICVDESGSMTGVREIWAKAVALAAFNLAAKVRRAYALIHFGSAYEIRVDRFPQPRKASPAEVLGAVEHFFGGGTDFQAPLARALEVLEESPYRRGDIVFITGGECTVSPGFLERFARIKREKEFSVFAVLVKQGTVGAVQPFADRVVLALPGKNDLDILEKIVAPA